MEYPEFDVEMVHCHVCHGTGKVPKLIWWTKDCSVCQGRGERTILLSRKLSPADKAMVMQSAIYGLNMFPRSMSEPPFAQMMRLLFGI